MIDWDHPVYLGHFPSNPVTPGAFQLQMINDVLQDHTGTPLMMSAARSIKFISPHSPGEGNILELDLSIKPVTEDKLDINATLSGSNKIYLRFSGEFKRIR